MSIRNSALILGGWVALSLISGSAVMLVAQTLPA